MKRKGGRKQPQGYYILPEQATIDLGEGKPINSYIETLIKDMEDTGELPF